MMNADALEEGEPLYQHRETGAYEKLVSILEGGVIYASPMPTFPAAPRVVCFTECIWDGLVDLAARYSPYGLVFSKRLIFEQGGGPALYVRGDHMRDHGEDIPTVLQPMVAPFDPAAVITPGVPLDWIHEREWRLSRSLEFNLRDLEYVIAHTVVDATNLAHRIGAGRLPENKILPIQVYELIRDEWRGS
jgi:hypothetical protein